MLILRIILGTVFGLLLIGLLLATSGNAKPITDSGFVLLGLFAFIILLLGPLWPSPETLAKLNHPIANPNVRIAMILVVAAISLYLAVNEWLFPYHSDHRKLKALYSFFEKA